MPCDNSYNCGNEATSEVRRGDVVNRFCDACLKKFEDRKHLRGETTDDYTVVAISPATSTPA